MINDKENETCITLQLTDNQLHITDYFPMQQDMNFPKLFLHTINKADFQQVTRAICHSCDKNNVFCDKFCDKNEVGNFIGRDINPVFRVKGKRSYCCLVGSILISGFFHSI